MATVVRQTLINVAVYVHFMSC